MNYHDTMQKKLTWKRSPWGGWCEAKQFPSYHANKTDDGRYYLLFGTGAEFDCGTFATLTEAKNHAEKIAALIIT